MRGKKTEKHLGAAVVALSEQGKTQTEIGEIVGVGQQTVADILQGNGKWASIKREGWFTKYSDQLKLQLQAASMALAHKALQHLDKSIERSSAAQAAVIYGILRDKARLDAGEATSNVAIVAHIEADALTKALDKLVNSLK